MKLSKNPDISVKLNVIILFYILVSSGIYTWYVFVPPQTRPLASEPLSPNRNFALPMFSYLSHSSIFIDGNSAFISNATSESWPGNGSLASPYQINNYNFTGSSSETLIEIRNTDIFFKISNCFLDRGKFSILFTNVTNAVVYNNTIQRSKGLVGQGDAIVLSSCLYNNFTHNRIIGHDHIAFSISNSDFLVISYNNISHNRYGGIYLSSSHNNTLTHNSLLNSSNNGISLVASQDNLVSNNVLEDQGKGIYLSSDANTNNITHNQLGNIGDNGIRISSSYSNRLINNTLNETARNIFLQTSPNNTLIDNHLTVLGIHMSGDTLKDYLQTQVVNNWINDRPLIFWQHVNGGIVPSDAGQVILINCTFIEISDQNLSNLTSALQFIFCKNMTITNNTVSDADYNGIYLYNTHMSLIQGNTFYRPVSIGIYVVYSHNNSFFENTIIECEETSLYVWGSHQNNFSQNAITRTLGWGMLIGQANNNTVMLNLYQNSSFEAIYCYDSNHNHIERNDFLFNNLGSSQAFDDQTNPTLKNIFTYNYWNTWTTPDNNSDRIVDQPYDIGGSANNQDLYPLTLPYLLFVHKVTTPVLVNPNGGEILSGMTTIQWAMAIDSWDHNVSYTLYSSSDNGLSWHLLQTGLSVPTYDWDTNTVADGSEYLIKVVAICSEGLITTDVSDGPFMIENLNHVLSIPHVLYPNGGEILSGEISVHWNTATDSWNHLVLYSIYYSSNNGSTWSLLASDLVSNTYQWNILFLDEGSYLIKVVANCTNGLTAADISDNIFSITVMSHGISPPQIIYPNGGEILSDSVQFQWTEGVDSLNHPITYALYLSYDNGVTWFELASSLMSPSYLWNSTSVADGGTYLVKIEAICSEGLIGEDISDDVFSIQNVLKTTTETTAVPPATSTTSTTTTTSDRSSPSWSFFLVFISLFSLFISAKHD
ncbi:MAG: right-handed parallel beta-helix repeat-containing protein [Candidatus Hodarchaeales archaeon]